jgi:hypothetical protein
LTVDGRPPIWCFVSRQIAESKWTGLALVTLETAAELKEKGWIVIGPDPGSEIALAKWDREHRNG